MNLAVNNINNDGTIMPNTTLKVSFKNSGNTPSVHISNILISMNDIDLVFVKKLLKLIRNKQKGSSEERVRV